METGTVIGVCRYCGQTQQVRAETQEEADARATQACQCDGARKEKRIRDVIRDAKERAEDLLGEGGALDGFVPIEDSGVRALIDAAIELIAVGELKEASMQINGRGAVKVKASGVGGVKIERSRTLKRSEETV